MIEHKQNVIVLLEMSLYLCTYLSEFYTSLFCSKVHPLFSKRSSGKLTANHHTRKCSITTEICGNNGNIHSLVLSFTNI